MNPIIPIVTVNAQSVTDPHTHVLHNVLDVMAGAGLVFAQEVSVPLLLRAKLARKLIGIHHARRGPQAGVAVLWDRSRFTAGKRGWVSLAQPERGDDMRERFGAWVDLMIRENGETLTAISAHRPLEATGDKPEFDRNLARFMATSPHPVIAGLDVNGVGPAVASRISLLIDEYRAGAPGVYWRGVGIDGWLIDQRHRVGQAFPLPRTRSDHAAIAAPLTVF